MICFFVCFFVLLLNSKFSRIPTDRILSKTMSQVVSEDLEDLGYIGCAVLSTTSTATTDMGCC